MKKNELVWVLWIDSVSPADTPWHRPSTLPKTLEKIMTIGCVQRIDRECVVLATSWALEAKEGDDSEIGGITMIPRKAILATGSLLFGDDIKPKPRRLTSTPGGSKATTPRKANQRPSRRS